MTATEGVRSIQDIMLQIVRSYPDALRRRLDIASVTRVFSRDLLLALIAAHAPTADDPDVVWAELIALPVVERRPNETFALHETTRLPLLADLNGRDRDFVSEVASSAFDYVLPQSGAADWRWVDLLEAVYYRLLMNSESAVDDVDGFLVGPWVSGYPARRSAVIAIAVELLEAGLLDRTGSRWTRIWQLEELVDSGQSARAIQIAKGELGADEEDFVLRDSDGARIANALALAHAQLGDTEAALALYEDMIASGADIAGGLAGVGDLNVTQGLWQNAEESYFAALEQVIRAELVSVTDASSPGSLRIRDASAWQMPFDVPAAHDGDTDEQLSFVFIEGVKGRLGDDAVDLIELDDGRCGGLVAPSHTLGAVWAALAEVYLSTGRLDEAQSAANTGGAIAEILDDDDGMSRAFDVLAAIGMQRGDTEFLRIAQSANRELLQLASQTGDPPSRLRASLRLGWSDVSAGHPARADAAFQDAQHLAREIDDRVAFASALLGTAEAARQQGRTDDVTAALLSAIKEYEQIEDSSSIASTRHQLGESYIAAGQPALASEALEAARLLFVQLGDLAGQARTRESAAVAASMVGDYQLADELINLGRSLARERGDPRVAVSVELTAGALLEERYEFGAAADVYRRALALADAPLYADLRALCRMNIGDAEFARDDHAAAEQYAEAMAAFRQIGDITNELRARALHAVTLSRLGDDVAIDVAEEIVASLPPDLSQDVTVTVYLARARVLAELGRHGEALQRLSEAALANMGIEPIIRRLDLLASIGRFDDVIAEIDQVLERDQYRADLFALKGWCLLHVDPPDAAAARTACDRALKLKPDDPWYQKDLATCLLALGQPEGADALANGVIARLSRPHLEELSIDTIKLLGFCMYQVRDYDGAKKHLTAAIERDSEDAVSDLDLALVEMCADSDRAADHYDRVVDKLATMNPDRRRGVLVVALRDVEYALQWNRVDRLPVANHVVDRIKSALSAIP